MKVFGSVLLPLIPFCAGPSKATEPPPDLRILSRADLGAKSPVAKMKRHEPSLITIHHPATLQMPDRPPTGKLQTLQKFSPSEGKLDNGKPKPAWPDVPYHFYIDCRGAVAEALDVNAVSDTNTEYDPTGHVLVALEGNFEKEQVTDAQWLTLRKMVSWLVARCHVVPANMQGHKDYAQLLCPAKDLQRRLGGLREMLEAWEYRRESSRSQAQRPDNSGRHPRDDHSVRIRLTLN